MDKIDPSRLSKKERKELKKQMKQQEEAKKRRFAMVRKWVLIGAVTAFLVGVGWWFIKEATKPLPGQAVQDIGREHVPDGTQVQYNSNPPTSGSHYADWTRAGIYEQPIPNGHLVHSLEHGYVIISYNCEKIKEVSQVPRVPQAFAHEHEGEGVSGQEGSAGGQGSSGKVKIVTETVLPESFNSQACKDLVKKLTDVAQEKQLRKLIVVPRPQLDTAIALTAWTRIDKFNPSISSGLNDFDKERIIGFIDTFRDQGPEKTME